MPVVMYRASWAFTPLFLRFSRQDGALVLHASFERDETGSWGRKS